MNGETKFDQGYGSAGDYVNQDSGFEQGYGGAPGTAAPGAQGQQPGQPAQPQGGAADMEALLSQYAQTRDPQLAVTIADALLQMMAQGQQQPA